MGTLSGAFRNRARGELAVPLRLVAVLSLCLFGLNYVLTYIAETHMSSGLVAVLFGTLPFFVYGFSYVMLGEPMHWRMVAGAACALIGVGVISAVGDMRGDLLYVGAALTASLLSAFANAYLKRWSHVEPFVILPIAMLCSGVACAAIGLRFEHFDAASAFRPGPLLAIAYLGVVGSAVSFYLMHRLLQRIDAGVFGLTALMIPIIALAVGILFGGEAFTVRDLAGAALVIGGVWLALARAPSTALRSAADDKAALRSAADDRVELRSAPDA